MKIINIDNKITGSNPLVYIPKIATILESLNYVESVNYNVKRKAFIVEVEEGKVKDINNILGKFKKDKDKYSIYYRLYKLDSLFKRDGYIKRFLIEEI